MKIKTTLQAIVLCALTTSLSAQFAADISFGYDQTVFDGDPSPYTTNSDVWGKLLDSTGTPLTSDNSVVGVIAGYSSTVPTTTEDWTLLAEGSVDSTFAGEIYATTTNVDVTAVIGQEVAILVVKGITDIASDFSNLILDGSLESLLLQDTSWASVSGAEAPSTATSLSYTFGKTSIGPIFDASSYANVGSLGIEVNDTRFGTEEGFNFQTVVVPEPSSFALLFGLSALLFVARRR